MALISSGVDAGTETEPHASPRRAVVDARQIGSMMASSRRTATLARAASHGHRHRPGHGVAGHAVSAGRHLRRCRHQLLPVLRGRRARRPVPDRRRTARRRGSPRRGRRLRLARLPAERSLRGSATATASTGRGSPPPGTGATRASCCWTPTARRSTATSRQGPSAVLLRHGRRPGRRLGIRSTAPTIDSLGHTMTSVVINPFFDWGSDRAPRTAVQRDDHLRGPRQGHDRRPIPASPTNCAAPMRGLSHPRGDRAPARTERHRDRADAGAPVHARLPAARPGPAKLLGLQHVRVLRAAQLDTRRSGSPAPRSPSSRPWSARSTRPASK